MKFDGLPDVGGGSAAWLYGWMDGCGDGRKLCEEDREISCEIKVWFGWAADDSSNQRFVASE